jgi:hypothetical protein
MSTADPALSSLPSPGDLARVLRAGARNQESLKVTAPVRKAVANRLNSLSGGTLVPARATVPAKEGTRVEFLDRLDLTKGRLFPTMRMNRSAIWWGIHFWGKQEEADDLFAAARIVGLETDGWALERGTGDPEMPADMWNTGGYVRSCRRLTAEQVDELLTLDELVSQIAGDLWWWYQRLEHVMVLAKWIATK